MGEEIIPGLFIINEPSIHRWSKQVDTIINLQKHNYSFGIILRTYFTFFISFFIIDPCPSSFGLRSSSHTFKWGSGVLYEEDYRISRST